MCDWVKSGENRIDPCMRKIIKELRAKGIDTRGSCCGHGVYPKTVVVCLNGVILEYFTKTPIPRKKRFYKRDANQHYYIPEVNPR